MSKYNPDAIFEALTGIKAKDAPLNAEVDILPNVAGRYIPSEAKITYTDNENLPLKITYKDKTIHIGPETLSTDNVPTEYMDMLKDYLRNPAHSKNN